MNSRPLAAGYYDLAPSDGVAPSGRLAGETVREALTEVENRALAGLPPEALAGFHTVLRALTEVRP